MKNMGLHDLAVVEGEALDESRAATLAVHAADVLGARRRVASLAEAIAGCGLVVGSSGRATATRDGGLAPRALAAGIVAAARVNDVALVFGPEDHGLALAELALCHRVVTIPSAEAYPSLNLAQAVLVCAYEVRVAAQDESPTTAAVRALAPAERVALLCDKLEAGLAAIGFLNGDGTVATMRRLRRLAGRAALDDDEVQMLLGVARQMSWAGARARDTIRN